MLKSIDQLDLASLALTRVAAFSDRDLPSCDEIDDWLRSRNPRWRTGTQGAEALARLAAHSEQEGSYGIPALKAAARRLVRPGVDGWELVIGPVATAILRWRLPLGTVHAAAAAAENYSDPGSPPCPILSRDFLEQLEESGAADGHVHVGTCLPFDGLFQILQSQVITSSTARPAAGSHAPLEFKDSCGKAFDPTDLLAYARVANTVLDGFLASESGDFGLYLDSAGIDSGLATALRMGGGWEFVHTGDPNGIAGQTRRIDAPERLLGPLSERDVQLKGNPYEVGIKRKLKLLRHCFNGPAGDAYTATVEDVLRCEALLYTALTQGNRAGLSEFLIRAKLLGKLRKSVPNRTRTVIRYGLPYLADGMKLKGIELRTAEQNDEHSGLEQLVKSLDAQLEGYEEAIGSMEDNSRPVATWPICLIKDPAMVAAPDRPVSIDARPRFAIDQIFALLELTTELFSRFPASRRLFPGFDVAGDENAVPSWCFALVFEEFLARIRSAPVPNKVGKLSFRVHAGEDFHSPLQGLRRVDEAIRWVIPEEYVVRIGHGLALTHSTTDLSASPLARQPLDEAFDDLVWAWSKLRNSNTVGNRHLLELLGEAITREGNRLYNIDAAKPEDYVRAYEMRFELEPMRSVGFLKESVHRNGHALGKSLSAPGPDAQIASRILFAYLTQCSLRRPCETPLIDPVWMVSAIDGVRTIVREAVKKRGAVIEVCPTSNLIIGGLDDYVRHPVHGWITEKFNITVNTDDPGLFSVTLRDEYSYLWASSSSDPDERLKIFRKIQKRSCDLMGSCRDAEETAELVAQVRSEWADVVRGKNPSLV